MERYWLEQSEPPRRVERPVLHPLAHQNTSSFDTQRFSSNFTGEEFFFRDHVVEGRRVLPGVAYIEMARAAVEEALANRGLEAERAGSGSGIRLEHMVWSRPISI